MYHHDSHQPYDRVYQFGTCYRIWCAGTVNTSFHRIKKAAANTIPVSVMVILSMYILVAVPLSLVNIFNNKLYAGKLGKTMIVEKVISVILGLS